MTKPDDIAILAGKLTEAQRSVLGRFRSERWYDGLYVGSLHVQRPGVVCASLARKGILEKRSIEYRLTPLGLALRSHMNDRGRERMGNNSGRVASQPGSREPDPQAVPALTGFDPSRDVTQHDRYWCTQFDRSEGFLEGKWDNGFVTMPSIIRHRVATEGDLARRIFDEVHGDPGIDTDAAIKVYAAIKRALPRKDQVRA